RLRSSGRTSLRAGFQHRSWGRSNGHLCFSLYHTGPLEPRRRAEPLEDLACLGEQRLRTGCLAVLQQRNGEPERQLEFAEKRGRGPVAGLVSGQLRPETVCVSLEQRRALTGAERGDRVEELLDLGPVAQLVRCLERLDEAELHREERLADLGAENDAQLTDGESLVELSF